MLLTDRGGVENSDAVNPFRRWPPAGAQGDGQKRSGGSRDRLSSIHVWPLASCSWRTLTPLSASVCSRSRHRPVPSYDTFHAMLFRSHGRKDRVIRGDRTVWSNPLD